jgi:flagellar basal body-associated protein FliL
MNTKSRLTKKKNAIYLVVIILLILVITLLILPIGVRQALNSLSESASPHVTQKSDIAVTKADYARPKEWINLDEIAPEIVDFIANQGEDITNVAEYFERADNPYGNIFLDNNNMLNNSDDLELGNLESTLYRLLNECPYDLSIQITPGGILYEIVSIYREDVWTKLRVYFNMQRDFTEASAIDIGWIKIAPHWFYSIVRPI